jgi:aryl-alcohol dehydrogenase-like predicted oxidoreductase
MNMDYTKIKNIETPVSRIGLGTWAIGGWMWGGTDEREAILTIHRALDLGVNLIDTAPAYGFGLSEEIVGKALKQWKKEGHIVIATKTGISWQGGRVYRDARPEIIRKEIEESLIRLQREAIDLYQLHWPDPLIPLKDSAIVLHDLLLEGKIRAVGVSNLSTKQMEEFQHYCPLHALQPPYNLFERDIEINELPYCLEHGIATLSYGSLCRGLLTGKIAHHKPYEGDDLRKIDPKYQEPALSAYLRCTKKLETWAKEKYNKPLLVLAIRWVLDKGISSALWGARHPNQLDGIDQVWGWKLTTADFAEIDQILKEIPTPLNAAFMAPPSRKEFANVS